MADLGLAGERDKAYAKLSGGQKQRLSMALALVGNPEIAVLDELTTGLDPQARRDAWQLIEDVRARGVTVLLVTHFMAEAERLCDRIALIDSGRIAVLDTPAGLISRVGSRRRIRFRPDRDLDDDLLWALPEVRRVDREGGQVIVTGDGDLLLAVASLLARHHVTACELQLDQPTLDDAFIALTTGRQP